MKRNSLLFLFISMIAISCTVMDPVHLESSLKKSMLNGRVFSEEGLPVEGVRVVANGMEAKTDINGKFLYNFIAYGNYKVTFEKLGYSKAEYSFVYNMKNKQIPSIQVILYSMNYLINEGYQYLKERNYSKAQEIITQLDGMDKSSNEEAIMYLKAMYNFTQENYTDTIPILEKLRTLDRDNDYYTLTLLESYKRLNMYQEQIDLCLFLGRKDPKNYLYYIRLAAELYRVNLNNETEYNKILSEYNKIVEKQKGQSPGNN